MLRLQVNTPLHGIFELLLSLQKNVDGLGVAQTHEFNLGDGFETSDQFLVEHIVEELEVVHVVVQRVLHQILDEILSQIHIVLDVVKGHFGLDHPELSQVARSVAVFGAERGTESIDVAKSHSTQLTFQLSGNGQVGVLAEEVLLVIDLTILGARDVVQIESGDVEHLTGALRIGSGDQRGVEIEETSVVEVFMDGESHGVTQTQHTAKIVRTRTQVGNLAQEFH